MNIDNLFDPMGGQGHDTMNTGMLAIAGFGMDHRLAERFLFKPMLRSEKRKIRKAGILHTKSAIREFNDFIGPTYPATKYVRRDKAQSEFKKFHLPGHKAHFRTQKNLFQRQKGMVKAIGWGFLVSAFAQLGEDLMTPGISKVAAKSNQELFMNENPLDSGAAYTQRQRALEAIYNSQMTVRNVLGNESSFMHR